MFTYDDEQFFSLNTLVVVNLKQTEKRFYIKFILAVMNSKLMNYYYTTVYKSTKKVFSEIQANTVGLLPIPTIDKNNQKPLITLVDTIIKLKKEGKDTAELEAQIDAMVYELYGLTDEEVKVVERENNV
ncbi:MAG: TaqI-like C-terminal specificity domain-containing protein [Sulfurovaceae bacterium]